MMQPRMQLSHTSCKCTEKQDKKLEIMQGVSKPLGANLLCEFLLYKQNRKPLTTCSLASLFKEIRPLEDGDCTSNFSCRWI